MKKLSILSALGLGALLTTGCGPDPKEQALNDVKTYVQTNLDALHQAAVDLRNDAPAPDADGWNATDDAAAVAKMKEDWKKARVAYERIEGAIAVLFPELDVSTDERYDGFIAEAPDDNLFDGEGVIGIHAVERILWSDSIPASVREFEEGLPNYRPAAFPATQEEAAAFKDGLLARLEADTKQMRDDFAPLELDPAAAFRGVIGSIEEQVEKVNLAATGEEESRYAQHTLADMRANVEGGREIFKAFSPWLLGTEHGKELDDGVKGGFDRLDAAYAAVEGDALPPVPQTWSSQNPSEADLATPFGKLWKVVRDEADPGLEGSTAHEMNHAAEALGIPELPE
ncbi:MAG: EfeM/EfeO family lipoprotein [Myxococcaceae bacterium]|nr:EfeM/EfeO family lipoprotein [Myxococcaceae bacterium]